MHRLIGPRGLAALFSLAAAALLAATLLVTARDTSAGRALAAPAADLPFTNDNFSAPGFVMPPPSPPDASILPWDGSQTTVGATLEPGESAPCGAIGATVWYYYQPDHAGTLEISTAGSNFDTILAVYTIGNGFLPSPPGGNLNNVACNDDAGGPTSFVSFPLTQWAQYYIQVGGKGGAAGNLRLHMQCNPACPPSNDDFAGAQGVWVDAFNPKGTWRVDTRAATVESGEPRPCGNIGATVWYSLYVGQDINVVADTVGSSFDTVLAAYGPATSFLPSPPGGLTPLGCNDNSSGAQSKLALHLSANTQYWFQAGGAGGASGDLVFNLACSPACPPHNDDFGQAGVANPPFIDETSTEGATLEPGEPRACGNTGATVWYGVYVYGNATVVADTAGSDFDTTVALYTVGAGFDGTPGTLDSVACSDGAGGPQARLRFNTTSGKTYFLQVGGRAGASGRLHLNIDCDPAPCPPVNDSASGSFLINVPASFPFGDLRDTRGATTDAGEPLDCDNMGRTVWYHLDSNVRTTVVLDTTRSSYHAGLAVYKAPPWSPPGAASERVACDGGSGSLRVDVEPGVVLFVQVGGVDGAGGDLELHADCVTACPPLNDNIASATWYGGSGVDSPRTTAATLEPGEPQPCGDIGATVWYRFQPAQDSHTRVSLGGSDFPAVVAVYRMDGMSPPGALTPIACADPSQGSAVEFDAKGGDVYYVQSGGVGGAGGMLQFSLDCGGCPGGPIVPPETGPWPTRGGGTITLPSTGSGGYLPGSRR